MDKKNGKNDERKNYRQMFEQANVVKAKAKNAKLLDETIIRDRVGRTPRFTEYSISGLLSCTPQATDQLGDVAAFIVEDHYSVGGAGIRYSIDFGVIKDKKVCRHGFFMVRGGTASERDDPARWYHEVKILEAEGDKVILGLGSGGALDIYEVDLTNGSFSEIESHDLAAERREAEGKKLQQEAELEQDFEKQAEKFAKKIESETGKRTSDPKIFKEEGIAIFRTSDYDRDYDAAVTSLNYYAYKKGWSGPKLVKTISLTYDQSVRRYEKYYKIYASVESSKPVKVGEKMKIQLKIEVVFSSSDPGRYRTETLRKTTDELTIE